VIASTLSLTLTFTPYCLIKVQVLSDILQAADKGDVAVLALLELSVAFSTVNHSILL